MVASASGTAKAQMLDLEALEALVTLEALEALEE